MFQGEHSAILSTFIKLPFSTKTNILSILKWPHKTEFTEQLNDHSKIDKRKVLMTTGSLMNVESIAECSLWSILQNAPFGAFCNTFDLH